jgi:hypothetical protein
MRIRLREALNTGYEIAAELGELAILSVARRWLGIPALEARVADLEREVATRSAPPPPRVRRYVIGADCPHCAQPMVRRLELRAWECGGHDCPVETSTEHLEEFYPGSLRWSS